MDYTANITHRPTKVVLANPLGAGLAHYTDALEHVVSMCGVATARLDVVEPSSGRHGRVGWLASYVHRLRRQVKCERPDAVLAAWPTAGYWDSALLPQLIRGVPIYTVMHDPRPFVRRPGYGIAPRKLADHYGGSIRMLVHSVAARERVARDLVAARIFSVRHPMLPVRGEPRVFDASRIKVRVLGRYKPGRDVQGLVRLAAQSPPDWDLEVYGRDWPSVRGWKVTSEILPEDRFENLIRTSDVVLIPYRQFFQSGVAVRALEAGIPVVGPREQSLEEMVGDHSGWLVDRGDWIASVAGALGGRERALERGKLLYEEVLDDWDRLFSTSSVWT
jgi:hypothetical protein